MEAKSCPMCRESKVVSGSVTTLDRPLTVMPNGTQGPTWGPGVPLTWNACLSCGFTWTSVSPQELRAFIATRGSELLRQHVSRLDHGWRYGLPDFLKCRFAAEKAAEID